MSSASSLETLALNVFGFIFSHTFFDSFRCAFNKVFGFFQAKTCNRADFLDDIDFLVAK